MTAWTPAHGSALLQRRLLSLNFHDVPADQRRVVADRVRRAADLGRSFDPDAESSEPQVLIGWYDGFRDTGLFAAELCADLGLRAFFFPLGSDPFADSDAERDAARLTDDDLADVATVHELCFHTGTHAAADEVDETNLEVEVLGPVRRLAAITGAPPRIGAWCGGARFDPGLRGNAELAKLGIRFLVSNWSVEPLPGQARS